MLDLIAKYEESLKEWRSALSTCPRASDSAPIPGVTVTNDELLMRTLARLFHEEKAKYLPAAVVTGIRQAMSDITSLTTLSRESKTETQCQDVIKAMDNLYALCLQYGIVTFGFTSKELTHAFDDAKRQVQSLGARVARLDEELQKKNDKTAFLQQAWEQKLIEDEQTAQQTMTQQVETASKTIAERATRFSAEADQQQGKIAESLAACKDSLVEMVKLREAAIAERQAVAQHLAASTQAINEIQKVQQDVMASKQAADTHVQSAAALTAQIQTQLGAINQIAAQVSAKNGTADGELAKIQERRKAADEFYKAVETYQQEMVEAGKKAKAEYADLKNACDNQVAEYKAKADAVVAQNVAYQEQIKDLLTKAVSGSLFHVFNDRQKSLRNGRRFWEWTTLVMSAGVITCILLIANQAGPKPDTAFFVRLSMAAPLAFLLWFCAKQSTKERQAEEEYAFKSAISLSLEPYRDMLTKMSKEAHPETGFVRTLMGDVFDNPVKRLYTTGNSDDEAKVVRDLLREITKAVSKIPSNELSKEVFMKLLETVGQRGGK